MRLRDEHRRRRRHPHADPARFLAAECAEATGNITSFLPRSVTTASAWSSCRPTAHDRAAARSCSSRSSAKKGQTSSAGATVPTDNSMIGPTAQVRRAGDAADLHRPAAAAARRHDDAGLRAQALRHPQARRERGPQVRTSPQREMFYVPSLSCKTLIYKGMLNCRRSSTRTSPTCSDPAMESALALVHSRFSTNTFPTWARAHPVPLHRATTARSTRCAATSTGCTPARACSRSELFGDDIEKILPIIDESGSDSAMFDNALELLVLAGRSLPHAMMMMIPEPWSGDETMSAGEAGVLRVPLLPDGAVGRPGLDRLHRRHAHRRRARPQRPAAVALLRHQGRPGHHGLRGRRARRRRRRTCCSKGRLQPGRMFLVDLEQGRIIADEELKQKIATEQPYAEWLRREPRLAGRSAASRPVAASSPITRPSCSGSRRSATPPRT